MSKVMILEKERTMQEFKGGDAGKLLLLFDELDINVENFTTSITERDLKSGKADQAAIMQEVVKFISQTGTKLIGKFGKIISKPLWKEIVTHTFQLQKGEFEKLNLKAQINCLKEILKAEGVLDFLQSLGVKKLAKFKLN